MAKKIHRSAALLPPMVKFEAPFNMPLASGFESTHPPRFMHIQRSKGTPTGQLILCIKGEGFFRRSSENWIISEPWDIFYYEPEVHQEYGDTQKWHWEYHWVHFNPKPHWNDWLHFSSVPGIPGLHRTKIISKNSRALALKYFQEIHLHLRLGGVWRVERAMHALEGILLLAGEESHSLTHQDSRIQNAVEAIAADPFKNFTVKALAESCQLSSSRFSHLFKKETGHSVIQLVIHNKVAQAKNLLLYSPKSISEISEILGFKSPQYFSLLFKKHCEISPKKFRNKLSR